MSQDHRPPEPIDVNAIYQDVKERVEKRFEWRTQLAGHTIAYLVFLFAGSKLFIYDTGLLSTEAYPIAALIWLGGLMIHMINVVMAEFRERALQRELEQAGIYPGMLQREKTKHDAQFDGNERLVRLTDEGELVDIDPYTDDEEATTQGASS